MLHGNKGRLFGMLMITFSGLIAYGAESNVRQSASVASQIGGSLCDACPTHCQECWDSASPESCTLCEACLVANCAPGPFKTAYFVAELDETVQVLGALTASLDGSPKEANLEVLTDPTSSAIVTSDPLGSEGRFVQLDDRTLAVTSSSLINDASVILLFNWDDDSWVFSGGGVVHAAQDPELEGAGFMLVDRSETSLLDFTCAHVIGGGDTCGYNWADCRGEGNSCYDCYLDCVAHAQTGPEIFQCAAGYLECLGALAQPN